MINTRIFFGDNGVLTDWTTSLNEYTTAGKSFSYTVNQDYIYIGQRSPFNHIYIKMDSTVNAIASVASVEYWNGKEWISAVEVIDETSVNGISLAQSGFISFVPDRDKSWDKEDTNYSGSQITGLTSVVIYDLYWMRIKFSATLTPSVGIKWMGYKFCKDSDLAVELPNLSRQSVRDVFSVGLSNYEEQIVTASKLLIDDLISKSIIEEAGNILVREQFTLACVYKLAEVIYTVLGDDYNDDKVAAQGEYYKRLNKSIFKVDTNNNATLDAKESVARAGFLSR